MRFHRYIREELVATCYSLQQQLKETKAIKQDATTPIDSSQADTIEPVNLPKSETESGATPDAEMPVKTEDDGNTSMTLDL